MTTSAKKRVMLAARLGISFGLVGYFLFSLARDRGGLGAALDQFAGAFAGASTGWLFPAFLLHLVGFSLVSLRWKIMLRAQGNDCAYRELFSYYFMAAFFNTFLPSTIGGDALRAMKSSKMTGSGTATSVMVVVVERLTGLAALVLIAGCALFVRMSGTAPRQRVIWIFLIAAATGFILLAAAVHPKIAPRILDTLRKFLPGNIHAWLEQAHDAVAIYYKRPGHLMAALAVSLVFQLNMVLYYYLIARALNRDPDPVDFMIKIPLMIFLLMVVPAINGLGVRTAGFKGLMKFPAAYALAMEFIDLTFRVIYGLLGGVIFLFRRTMSENENHKATMRNA